MVRFYNSKTLQSYCKFRLKTKNITTIWQISRKNLLFLQKIYDLLK